MAGKLFLSPLYSFQRTKDSICLRQSYIVIFQNYWGGVGERVYMMWLLILLVKLSNSLTFIVDICIYSKLNDFSCQSTLLVRLFISLNFFLFCFKCTHISTKKTFLLTFYYDNPNTYIKSLDNNKQNCKIPFDTLTTKSVLCTFT